MSPRRPLLTLALMGACVFASLPPLLMPSLRDTLGDGALKPVVRLVTSPFVHGFSAASLIPHLAGNLVLLWYAGSRVERRLGTTRFALLNFAALVAYAAIQMIHTYEMNGASVFVWAYAPPLAVLHRARLGSERASGGDDTTATAVVLTVMWVVVPLLMTAVPYTFGWSAGLVEAFLVANTFHVSATVVGIGMAWAWREQLKAAGVGSIMSDRADSAEQGRSSGFVWAGGTRSTPEVPHAADKGTHERREPL